CIRLYYPQAIGAIDKNMLLEEDTYPFFAYNPLLEERISKTPEIAILYGASPPSLVIVWNIIQDEALMICDGRRLYVKSTAVLYQGIFNDARFNRVNFHGADLSRAGLSWAILSEADLSGANLTGCSVYAISAWNVNLQETIQSSLIITDSQELTLTVDNLEV